MSDEASFLETLKANPADDTTRLVYADWLDEHGEPAKAEYLRLVVSLTESCKTCAANQPTPIRVLALAAQLPAVWRISAGGRFGIRLDGYPPALKVSVIRALRGLTGQSLAQTKALSESLPARVLACVPFEQALGARDVLRDVGSVTHIDSSDLTSPSSLALYRVEAVCYLDVEPDREDTLVAFAAFLAKVLSVGPGEAERLASQESVVLADKLELYAAQARMTEVRAMCAPGDLDNRWGIYFYPSE